MEGECVADCVDPCAGRACGTHPDCGTVCGTCGEDEVCASTLGQCIMSDLVLDGRTWLEDARVIARVGAGEFETVSDGRGRFSVGVEVADADAVVVVRVVGSGEQASLGFASVVGPVGDLSAAAGADRVLDASEEHSLVVDELATARYAALFAAGGAITSRAALEAATDDINEPLYGGEMLSVAAALRRIARSELALPAGFSDVLTLVEDIRALRTLTASIETDLAALRTELAREGRDRFVPSDLSSHFVELLKKRNGYLSSGGERYDFEPGGGGVRQKHILVEIDPQSSFTWRIDDGTLRTDYGPSFDHSYERYLTVDDMRVLLNDPSITSQVRSVLGADGFAYVPAELVREEIVPLHLGPRIDWVAVQETWRYRFDEALGRYGIEAPSVESVDAFYGTTWRRASELTYEPFTREEVLGTWALRSAVVSDLDEVLTDGFVAGDRIMMYAMTTFSSDGTATAVTGPSSITIPFRWELDPQGFLILTHASGEQQTFARWGRIGALEGLMGWYRDSSSRTFTHYQPHAKVDPTFELMRGNLTNATGQYWQSTINFSLIHFDGPLPDWIIAGYELRPNDAASRVFDTDPQDDWSWETTSEGVSLERRFDRDRIPRCLRTDPSCFSPRQRSWLPVAMQNDLLISIEWETWIRDYFYTTGFEWSDAAGAWIDEGGVPIDTTSLYLVAPRLNAYYAEDLPR